MILFIKKNWLIILILSIAAIFRLYRISDYMEFLGDQGRDVVIVRDFLKNGNLFFIGPQTSIGNMYLGPFYYYLIAPSLLLANFNPVGPAVFIAFLGVATVFLVYKITFAWFSPNTALISSFLYAISPVVIKYSNFSWNPNIMPFFALAFVYFFIEALNFQRYRLLIFASLSFVMALNSHYLALILLPFAGLIWLFNFLKLLHSNPKKANLLLKYTILSALLFIVSLTPQILFDIKHQGQNINALTSFFTYRETTVNLKAYKALPQVPLLFNQINTSLLAGKMQNFGPIISLIFFVGWLFSAYKTFKHPKTSRQYFFVISLWLLIGLIGLGLYKQHLYDHYYGFIFPAVFILVAVIINHLGKYAGLLFFILITTLSLLQNPFRWPPPHQLNTTQKIIQSIISNSNSQPFNFALLAKTNYDPGYRYFFYENNQPIFNLSDRITNQLFVVCEPHPDINCQPINNPEWGIAAFGWAKIDREWQIDGINIYKLVPNHGS